MIISSVNAGKTSDTEWGFSTDDEELSAVFEYSKIRGVGSPFAKHLFCYTNTFFLNVTQKIFLQRKHIVCITCPFWCWLFISGATLFTVLERLSGRVLRYVYAEYLCFSKYIIIIFQLIGCLGKCTSLNHKSYHIFIRYCLRQYSSQILLSERVGFCYVENVCSPFPRPEAF